MKTVPVDSSFLAGIGYDAPRKEMRVVFRHGGVVDHVGVDAQAYAELMSAESKGSHYHRHIKDRYTKRHAEPVAPMQDEPPATAITPERAEIGRGRNPAVPPHDLDAAIRRFRGEEE